MNKKNFIQKFEEFELHHKILTFIGIVLLTILFVRLAVNVYNPNPIFFGIELHHFDYGLMLLMISVIIILFANMPYFIELILCAISFGLILDELWLVRVNIIDSKLNDPSIYFNSFPTVMISIVLLVLIVIFTNHFRKKINQ
ncbi:MAG TPA: hypothetical protein V6C58_28980 [Allocoleopsis sp.]